MIFFHHIFAIDVFQISQDKFFFGKRVISPICGFFWHFSALFGTFTTRYNHPDLKFKFSSYFYPYKRFIQKLFLNKVFISIKIARKFKFYVWMIISGSKSAKKGQKMPKKVTNWTYNAFSKFFLSWLI